MHKKVEVYEGIINSFINYQKYEYNTMDLENAFKIWRVQGILLAMFVGIFFLCYYFASTFIALVVGIILIFITESVNKFYTKLFSRFNLSKSMMKFVNVFVSLVTVGFFIYLMALSAGQIGNAFAGYNLENESPVQSILKERGYELFDKETVDEMLSEENFLMIQEQISVLLFAGVAEIGFFLLTASLVIPFMFYSYYSGNSLSNMFSGLFPKGSNKRLQKMGSEIGTQFKNYFNAKLMESLIIGLISSIGFFLVGIEGWLFLGILAGFLNIIPYLGPILGAVLPSIVALSHSMNAFVLVLVVVLIAQIVDNFYLIPFMISDKIQTDSLVSVLLILIGSSLFGIFGMIFIIPMYLITKIVMTQIQEELVKMYS